MLVLTYMEMGSREMLSIPPRKAVKNISFAFYLNGVSNFAIIPLNGRRAVPLLVQLDFERPSLLGVINLNQKTGTNELL